MKEEEDARHSTRVEDNRYAGIREIVALYESYSPLEFHCRGRPR